MAPEDFADPVVDLIVLGEGVETFREICAERARGGADYARIAGLAIPPGATARFSTPRSGTCRPTSTTIRSPTAA